MLDKIFQITGNKIATFIADEESLKFTSSTTDFTVEGFRDSFTKTLSLSNKVEIKYEKITSIKKEENDDDVMIKYKNMIGLPSECEFSFNNPTDLEEFFTYMEKERYFKRINETLTPMRAIRNYLIGLIATLVFGYFIYFETIAIENGTASEPRNSKGRMFNFIFEKLGHNGVLLVGLAVAGYLFFQIWKRYKQPPHQTRLLPPNS